MSRYFLIAGLAIATTVASLGNNTTAESAEKPLTVTQAAQKLTKKQKSCYINYKYKKVSATIKISARNSKELKSKTKSISKKVKSLTSKECYETCKTDFTVTKTGNQKLKAGKGTAVVKRKGKTWTVKYTWMAGNSKYANNSNSSKPSKPNTKPSQAPDDEEESPGATTELSESEKYYRSLIQKEIKELTDGQNDFVKVALIGQWIQEHYTYDFKTNEKPWFESWYKGIHYGMCSATSGMTKGLCDIAGVKCTTATSEKMGHARNIVEIDGERFYVDCGSGATITDMNHNPVCVAQSADGEWFVAKSTFMFGAEHSFIQNGVFYRVVGVMGDYELNFVYSPEEWVNEPEVKGVTDMRFLEERTHLWGDEHASDDYGIGVYGENTLDWRISSNYTDGM